MTNYSHGVCIDCCEESTIKARIQKLFKTPEDYFIIRKLNEKIHGGWSYSPFFQSKDVFTNAIENAAVFTSKDQANTLIDGYEMENCEVITLMQGMVYYFNRI